MSQKVSRKEFSYTQLCSPIVLANLNKLKQIDYIYNLNTK